MACQRSPTHEAFRGGIRWRAEHQQRLRRGRLVVEAFDQPTDTGARPGEGSPGLDDIPIGDDQVTVFRKKVQMYSRGRTEKTAEIQNRQGLGMRH